MGRESRQNPRSRFQARMNGARPSHLITGAPGDPVVLDAFGRTLQVGDGVINPATGAAGVVWTITGIHRVLDPRAPAGLIVLGLLAEMPVQAADRQRCGLVLVVPQEASEAGEAVEPVETRKTGEANDASVALPTDPSTAPTGEGDRHDTSEPPAPPGPSRIVGLDGQPLTRDPEE